MQKRNITWSRLLKLHGQEYRTWLDENEKRFQIFNKLAEDLEHYVIESLKPRPYEDASTDDLCKMFVYSIPDILGKCDDAQIYEQNMAALAYAHVHLLERYRRFWDILLRLLDQAVLPMSDNELEVLDVGTGPAPALYAVYDFYRLLQEYAREKDYPLLGIPFPKLSSVESSRNMEHFMHIFSEVSQRTRGPYATTFHDFKGLDFTKVRAEAIKEHTEMWKENKGKQWHDYYDYQTQSWESWSEEMEDPMLLNGLYRYNFVIFSNFLTNESDVKEWKEELKATFLSVRHGGIVAVTGGSENLPKYEPIYPLVREIAKEAHLDQIIPVSGEIACQYSDAYAKRIKQHYDTVWRWIKSNSVIDDPFLASYRNGKLSDVKSLWDPNTDLQTPKSPKEFTLLVFRRNQRPPKLRKKR